MYICKEVKAATWKQLKHFVEDGYRVKEARAEMRLRLRKAAKIQQFNDVGRFKR